MTLPRNNMAICFYVLWIAAAAAAASAKACGSDGAITVSSVGDSTAFLSTSHLRVEFMEGCYERSNTARSVYSAKDRRVWEAGSGGHDAIIIVSSSTGLGASWKIELTHGSVETSDNHFMCFGETDRSVESPSPADVDHWTCGAIVQGSFSPAEWVSVEVTCGCYDDTTEDAFSEKNPVGETEKTGGPIVVDLARKHSSVYSLQSSRQHNEGDEGRQEHHATMRSLTDTATNATTNGTNNGNDTNQAVGDCAQVALEEVVIMSEDFPEVQGVYTKSCAFETVASGAAGDGRAAWFMIDDDGQPLNDIFYSANNGTWSVRNYPEGIVCYSVSSTKDPTSIATKYWLCDGDRDNTYSEEERGDWSGILCAQSDLASSSSAASSCVATTSESSSKSIFQFGELNWALAGAVAVLFLGLVACCLRTRRRKNGIATSKVTLDDAYPEDTVLPWSTRGPPSSQFSTG